MKRRVPALPHFRVWYMRFSVPAGYRMWPVDFGIYQVNEEAVKRIGRPVTESKNTLLYTMESLILAQDER